MKKMLVFLGAVVSISAMQDKEKYPVLYDVETFRAVQRIQSVIDTALRTSLQDTSISYHLSHDDDDKIHHHLRQMEQGVVVEWALCAENRNKKVPRELWTPWGKVPLIGSIDGDCSKVEKAFSSLVLTESYESNVALYLPGVYESVLMCGNVSLPKPVHLHREAYRPIVAVQAAWQCLMQHE